MSREQSDHDWPDLASGFPDMHAEWASNYGNAPVDSPDLDPRGIDLPWCGPCGHRHNTRDPWCKEAS